MSSESQKSEEYDEIDLIILNKLQENANIGYEELGNSVDLAESSVRYRVKGLEERGIIQSYMVVLDKKKLGYDLFVFAELDVEAGKERLVAQKLQKYENVVGLFSVSGQPDMVALILARNDDELTDIIEGIRAIKEVHKMTNILTLRTYKMDMAIKIPIKIKEGETKE